MIVLTADASPEARVGALNAGANDFLTKPFDTVEVLVRIRNQLETRRAHVALHDRGLGLSDLVSRRTLQLERTHRALLDTLANTAEVRDDQTGRHVQRVGSSALTLAQAIGLPAEEARMIGDAAPLHDLGKIGIPDAILLKPARLTKEEFAVIKTHSEVGAAMLQGEDIPLLEVARSIALTHHERWDGAGYPRGLSGEDIPMAGRIVSVVDVFDALIHARPYKPAWPVDRALEEIDSNRGTQFDPVVVDTFMSMQGRVAIAV